MHCSRRLFHLNVGTAIANFSMRATGHIDPAAGSGRTPPRPDPAPGLQVTAARNQGARALARSAQPVSATAWGAGSVNAVHGGVGDHWHCVGRKVPPAWARPSARP
jgi:hypothetical protein